MITLNICKQVFYLVIVSIIFLSGSNSVMANELNWVWFYSDDRYSEYFSPESIKVIRDYNGNIEQIEVWTKTTYDDEGRNVVINNYGLNDTPNIWQLSYSLGKIYIRPNSREIVWQNEIFYNDSGNVLWHEEKDGYSLDWQEVCPGDYAERHFIYIIDQVFHNGQPTDFDIWKGNNRWAGLSKSDNLDGTVRLCWFDKLLLRNNNNIATYWIFENIQRNNSIIEKYYIKMALDMQQKKYNIVGIKSKNKNGEWEYHNTTGDWSSIVPGSVGDNEATIIMNYINQNKIENFTQVSGNTKESTNNYNFDWKWNNKRGTL